MISRRGQDDVDGLGLARFSTTRRTTVSKPSSIASNAVLSRRQSRLVVRPLVIRECFDGNTARFVDDPDDAPGTAAPDSSFTIPRIVLSPVWADATRARNKMAIVETKQQCVRQSFRA